MGKRKYMGLYESGTNPIPIYIAIMFSEKKAILWYLAAFLDSRMINQLYQLSGTRKPASTALEANGLSFAVSHRHPQQWWLRALLVLKRDIRSQESVQRVLQTPHVPNRVVVRMWTS